MQDMGSHVCTQHFLGGSVYYTVYVPDGTYGKVVVACMPVGEERNHVSHTVSSLLKYGADMGVAGVLFDYPGMGESGGTAGDFSLQGSLETGMAVLNEAFPEYGSLEMVFLGVRSGSFTAADLYRELGGFLILWEPFISGEQFIKDLRLRERIRGSLTGSEEDGTVCINGEESSPEIYSELKSRTDILEGIRTSDVHVVRISNSGTVPAQYRSISKTGSYSSVSCPPFWNAHEHWDTSPCIRHTARLLLEEA